MPFTGRPAATTVQAQQRAVLNEVLTGIIFASRGENEKGRREAGLSVFS